jgi:hypothetical protein
MWHIRAICFESQKKKRMAIEFIKIMEKELKLLGLKPGESDPEIELELAMLEMARRYTKQLECKNKNPDKPPLRVITFEDAEMMIDKKAEVPFEVDSKFIESLKKDIITYKKEFVKPIEALFEAVPEIAEYDEILTKMQYELLFISPHEREILQMKKNYDFIMTKVKEYPELQPD